MSVRSLSALRAWSFYGCRGVEALPPDAQVQVRTPPSVVAAIRHGLQVDLHPSATV